MDEATIERASADVSAKVETLFGTEESKLDKTMSCEKNVNLRKI